MIIEFATLPPIIQQYIEQNQTVELKLVNGQVIATPQRVERPFNFEIEELDKAIHAPTVEVPHFDDGEDFIHWLNQLTDTDFVEHI